MLGSGHCGPGAALGLRTTALSWPVRGTLRESHPSLQRQLNSLLLVPEKDRNLRSSSLMLTQGPNLASGEAAVKISWSKDAWLVLLSWGTQIMPGTCWVSGTVLRDRGFLMLELNQQGQVHVALPRD